MNQHAVFSALTRGAKFNKTKVVTHTPKQRVSLVDRFRQKQEQTHRESGDKSDDSESSQDEEESKDETEEARKFFHIKVKGRGAPPLLLDFKDLEMCNPHLPLLANIEDSNFKEPTPVQMQAIPAIMSKRDVVAVAPTGSGKTAAYLIPRLAMLERQQHQQHEASETRDDKEYRGVHTLVIVPTHELADQIERHHERLTANFPRHLRRSCSLTKANKDAVVEALKGDSFYCLVVATPLLLIESLEKIDKEAQVACIVFDEADRLFESTFVEQTDSILSKLREENQQRVMLSATMPGKVEKLASTLLRTRIHISVGRSGAAAATIEQNLVYAGTEDGKMVAFRRLLKAGKLAAPTLIFVESKERAKEICRDLRQEGIRVDAMHGERSPAQRDAMVREFREGKLWFLVATEILARGVDFKGTNTVVNWDLPATPVSYIHRIGRCGRAGRQGVSITFFTDIDVAEMRVRGIANIVKNSGFDVADWIMQLKKRNNRFKTAGGSSSEKAPSSKADPRQSKRVKLTRKDPSKIVENDDVDE